MSTLFSRAAGNVTDQSGLLAGKDPTIPDAADPLKLWIVQLAIIIIVTSLLGVALKKIRQPKVIAEVIGGILLGPTALGRVPGFTNHIFPKASITYLNLTANMGLCLFLFIIGLEVDGTVLRRNAKQALAVSLTGLIIPFGLGAALSIPLYNAYSSSDVHFSYFLLFNGVAHAITAFPVLCRILVETRLIETDVGLITLAAGVGNDVVGWVLLALSVALAKASSGVTAVYILLCTVAFVALLLTAGKWIMNKLADITGSIENGPSMLYMTITIVLLFGCSFFTDIIGVHAIFGAFVAGLIIPRRGGLAIALTEKIEDVVSIIFLPLYFTLSGLQTNLGYLDNGKIWGYTIAIVVVAFLGKFVGCSLSAKAVGLPWRESGAVGTLMSCKGLVELIVLNIGLNAGILSPEIFSMFVFQAILLTFATTPLTLWIYPTRLHGLWTTNQGNKPAPSPETGKEDGTPKDDGDSAVKTRFTVILDKVENLPGMMALTQLLHGSVADTKFDTNASETSVGKRKIPVTHFDAVRLVELSDRTSAVMKSSTVEKILRTDPLLSVFRMFGELNDVPMTTTMSIVPADDMANHISVQATNSSSQLILVPWLQGGSKAQEHTHNPFETFFGAGKDSTPGFTVQSNLIRNIFASAHTNVGIYLDNAEHYATSDGLTSAKSTHLYLPFIGGPDDRLALELVTQLCLNPKVSATIVRYTKSSESSDAESDVKVDLAQNQLTSHSATFPDTVYGAATTQTRLHSETADNVLWAQFNQPSSPPNEILAVIKDRVVFKEASTPEPVKAIIEESITLSSVAETKGERIIIVAGRSKRMATESHTKEVSALLAQSEARKVPVDIRKTLGEVSTGLVASGKDIGLMIVQAAE